jgi:hypothetical protein
VKGLMSLTQILSLAEHTVIATMVGTTTGMIMGRLVLPGLWKDFKEWRRTHRDAP